MPDHDHRAYLDNAASSPLRQAAKQALARSDISWANPAALHTQGRRARQQLEDARESVAASLDCHPSEVIWTSGGSEANSIAALGLRSEPSRPGVAILDTDHPSIRGVVDKDVPARRVPVLSDGTCDISTLGQYLDGNVGLMCAALINNETGTVQPMVELAEVAHRSGTRCHTDAVQVPGVLPLSFSDLGVDSLALSGHKFGAPAGIGVLVLKRDASLAPYGLGGGQERSIRSGTQPTRLAIAFADTLRVAVEQQQRHLLHLAELWHESATAISTRVDGVHVNEAYEQSPAILSVTFDGLRADDMLVLLDQAGIDASTGSACRAGVHRPSPVMLAMGRDERQAMATLRFSFGHQSTMAEVEKLVDVIPRAVSQARQAFMLS